MALQRTLNNLRNRVRALLRPLPRERPVKPAPLPPRPLLVPLPLVRMAGVLPSTAAFLAARQRNTLGWGWRALPALPAWTGREPPQGAASVQRASWRGVLPEQLARFAPAVRPLPGPAVYRRFAQERLATYMPSPPVASHLPEAAPPEEPLPGPVPDVEPGPPHGPEFLRRLLGRGTARGAAPPDIPPPARPAEPGLVTSPWPVAAMLPGRPAMVPAAASAEPPAAATSERSPAGPSLALPGEPPSALPARPRPPAVAVVLPEGPSPAPPAGGPRPLSAILQSLARALGLRPQPAPPPPAARPLPQVAAPPPAAGAARPPELPLAGEAIGIPSAAVTGSVPSAPPEPFAGRPVDAPVPPGAEVLPVSGSPETPSAPPLPVATIPPRPRLEALPPSPAPLQPLPRLAAAPPAVAPAEPVGPVLAAAGDEARHLAPEARRRLARLGEGAPIPQATRRFLEGVLQRPLADVRLHTGPDAAAVTREVGALAATVGQHVLLSATRPDESTPQGLALLAHEALHAVQGGRDRPGAPQSRQEEAAARRTEEAVLRAVRATPPSVRYPPPAMPLPPSIAAEGSVPTVAQAVREAWAAPRPMPAVPGAGPLRRAVSAGGAESAAEPPAPQGAQSAAPPTPGAAPDLDALAEEVLRRIRYRLELERERRGY